MASINCTRSVSKKADQRFLDTVVSVTKTFLYMSVSRQSYAAFLGMDGNFQMMIVTVTLLK
jgi:hypothetical protein